MKTLVQQIALSTSVLLSIGLTSCEKDSLLTPDQASRARFSAVDEGIVVSIPQIHKLTRHGEATLTYADNGQLLAVTTPVRGSMNIQTDYTYSPGKIRAFTHQGKIVLHDETFTLDASGRCTESVEVGVASDIHWTFNYDTKGRLESVYNKNSCVGGVSYYYNTDGDLGLAMLSTSPSNGISIAFFYNKPTGDPLQDDKYPLNVSLPRLAGHDMYLRIFGKPSRHLLKQVAYTSFDGSSVPGNLSYVYTLDTEGYVTQKTEYDGQSIKLPKTSLYAYDMVNITVQP
ncbi:hypothetical protein [Spirosoma fluminis]